MMVKNQFLITNNCHTGPCKPIYNNKISNVQTKSAGLQDHYFQFEIVIFNHGLNVLMTYFMKSNGITLISVLRSYYLSFIMSLKSYHQNEAAQYTYVLSTYYLVKYIKLLYIINVV